MNIVLLYENKNYEKYVQACMIQTRLKKYPTNRKYRIISIDNYWDIAFLIVMVYHRWLLT